MAKTQWNKQELETLTNLVADNKPVGTIALTLNRPEASVRGQMQRLGLHAPNTKAVKPDALDSLAHPEKAKSLEKPDFGRLPLACLDSSDWVRIGLVADTHLCCKEERLEALHQQYDLFKAEGINRVLHAGNPIDGYVARINGESVFASTIDGQAKYFADNYPNRKGINTYFITGDDHESWFAPGFNIGAYLQHVAEELGREDLHYIGHVESDIEFKIGKSPTMLKLMHPGGGSAYSRSYIPQKIVESLEGGEKPAILVLGHYHVHNYCVERNIHVISMPGFQDQTIFARKKRLRMEVGGAILEFKVNPDDGTVTRCKVEFNLRFNRGYYKRYIRSDAYLNKGHLVLK
jgi:predicted phosphodiesterase